MIVFYSGLFNIFNAIKFHRPTQKKINKISFIAHKKNWSAFDSTLFYFFHRIIVLLTTFMRNNVAIAFDLTLHEKNVFSSNI